MKAYCEKTALCETSNLSGCKLSKNDPVIHFIGTLDELNSHLGLIKAMFFCGFSGEDSAETLRRNCKFIETVQKNLMNIMTYVSFGGKKEQYSICIDDVNTLEQEIKRIKRNIPKQSEFIIPGKNIIEAQINIARTIARRAERYYLALDDELCPNICAYLNRLSEYLFVLACLASNGCDPQQT